MWTIRQEQVESFRRHHLQKFENYMVAHLKGFAPKHWQTLGEPTGRQAIQFGIERARRYGFTNHGPVRFYIDLMFIFGSYFDTDQQFPWANTVLNDPQVMDQTVRADRLFDAMNQYMVQVRGPKHRYFIEAIRRSSKIRIEKIARPGVPLEESAVDGVRDVYQRICDYLGDLRLRAMIRESFAIGQRYGLTSDKAMLLMVALTIFMGHGFYEDPLCAWIARRLDSRRFPDPTQRTEELYSKAVLYMEYVLADGKKVQA